MKAQEPQLNVFCPAKKLHYLLELGDEPFSAARADDADECRVWRHSGGDRWEFKDDGRKLVCLEVDGCRIVRDLERLARADRALEKIKVSAYGYSDVSDRPNPLERLDAAPKTIRTFDKEPVFDRDAAIGGIR
jgi:RNA polymerase-binding transcription factor DksA